jgi:hypothetical protein
MVGRTRVTRGLSGIGMLLMLWGQGRAQDPSAGLLTAERITAELSRDSGLVRALDRSIHPAGILLWPGAPIVQGGAEVRRLSTAMHVDSLRLTWQPLGVQVAADSSLGITWGVAAATTGLDVPTPRLGRYIAAWRRDGARWTIAALVFSGLRVPEADIPNGIRLTRPPLQPRRSGKFVAADLEFARLAADSGAAVAFERWAAPTAVTFGDRGMIANGPKAIARTVAGPALWRWHPVGAGAAKSGELGWTVGEAIITGEGSEPAYSKYLTAWVQLEDGSIRFLTDGGNNRPAPR